MSFIDSVRYLPKVVRPSSFKHMFRRLLRNLFIWLLIAGCAKVCFAKAAEAPQLQGWLIGAHWENDVWGGSDKWYTNGAQLSVVFPDVRTFHDRGQITGWTADLIALGPFLETDSAHVRYALSGTHLAFTPASYQKPYTPGEHPYAGWGRIDGSLRVYDEHRLDIVEVSLGVTGHPALAREIQHIVHEWVDSPKPHGWGDQIPFEPTVNLTWTRHWNLREPISKHWAWAVTPMAGATVGNVKTHALAGVDVRLGYHLPYNYGKTRLMLGGRQGEAYGKQELGDWSFVLLGGFDLQAKAYDATIEGTLFRDSFGVDKEPFVGDFRVGMEVGYKQWRLSATEVFRTQTFKGQDSWQTYGSLALGARF
jgi:hypothetical protein